MLGFEELGCLPKDDSDAVGSESSVLYDKACIGWRSNKTCRGGLPFYRMHSDAMSPGVCMEFGLGKGWNERFPRVECVINACNVIGV